MSAKILLPLFASVSLASVSQIVLKTSLSQPHRTLALDGGSYFNAAMRSVSIGQKYRHVKGNGAREQR